MSKIIQNALVSAVVAIVIVIIGLAVGGNNQSLGINAPTRFPNGYLDTGGGYYVDGTAVIDGSGNVDGPITSTTGTFSSTLGVTGATTLTGQTTMKRAQTITPATALTDVLTIAESGTTFYVGATTTTYTLPTATTSAGVFYRFVVSSAFTTSNVVIDSGDGDNIDGTLIVAGAVVDCRGEDQIDFVNDGEQLGDFVEVYSDGVQWYIGASGALTASKLTCTDPS